LTSKKCAKIFNFLCASNKDFVKYQAQGGVLTPKVKTGFNPLRTPLILDTEVGLKLFLICALEMVVGTLWKYILTHYKFR